MVNKDIRQALLWSRYSCSLTLRVMPGNGLICLGMWGILMLELQDSIWTQTINSLAKCRKRRCLCKQKIAPHDILAWGACLHGQTQKRQSCSSLNIQENIIRGSEKQTLRLRNWVRHRKEKLYVNHVTAWKISFKITMAADTEHEF